MKTIFVIIYILMISFTAIYANGGGGRDETRACITPKDTAKTIYINCIWTGDVGDIMDKYDKNGKTMYKYKPGILDLSDRGNYGFYTCTGNKKTETSQYGSNLSDEIVFFDQSNCIKQGGFDILTDPVELVVEEYSLFGTNKENFIYTKVSGSTLKLRFFNRANTSSWGTGIDDGNCTIYLEGKQVYNGIGSLSWLSGGGSYIIEYKLEKSGQYQVQCSGKKGNQGYTSPKLEFYTFPASYSLQLVATANGNTFSTDSKPVAANGSINGMSLLGNKFPVEKVGNSIDVKLVGKAFTKENKIDTGVSTTMNNTAQTHTIDGESICKASKPSVTFKNASFSQGQINSNISSLKFNEVYKGKIGVTYYDTEMMAKIQSEQKRGGCSGIGTADRKCPQPPTFQFNFDYLFVINNFKIDVTTSAGNPIKVLYYGQGSSPANEGTVKLKISPLLADGTGSKNFIGGCAAIDTDLELTSKDLSVTLTDPNNISSTQSTTTTIKANDFATQGDGSSMAILDRVLSIKKQDNTQFKPNEVAEPSFLNGIEALMYFTGKKNDPTYPQYANPDFDSLKNMVVLRGRINAIDADNAQNYGKTPTTKVYYEFYCRTCNLCDVGKITGVDNNACTKSNYQPSATQQGWFIDKTFSTYNSTIIKKENISTQSGINVNNVGAIKDGVQEITYNNINIGKYQMKIEHGKDADQFPLFLLYNPYYTDNNTTTWGTSSFVTIYSKSQENTEDFGLDTGDAKNTRSGGRTGGY